MVCGIVIMICDTAWVNWEEYAVKYVRVEQDMYKNMTVEMYIWDL